VKSFKNIANIIWSSVKNVPSLGRVQRKIKFGKKVAAATLNVSFLSLSFHSRAHARHAQVWICELRTRALGDQKFWIRDMGEDKVSKKSLTS
jgi:hypothetical protein